MNSDSIRSRVAKPGEVAMKAHELLTDDNPRIIDKLNKEQNESEKFNDVLQ